MNAKFVIRVFEKRRVSALLNSFSLRSLGMHTEAITPATSITTENVRGTRTFHPAACDESSALDENIFSAGKGGEGGENNCGLTIGETGRDKGKEDVAIRTLMQRGRKTTSAIVAFHNRHEHFRYERARNA